MMMLLYAAGEKKRSERPPSIAARPIPGITVRQRRDELERREKERKK